MSGKDTSQLKKHGVNYESKSFSLSHDLLYITAILWSIGLRILTSCVDISINQIWKMLFNNKSNSCLSFSVSGFC